MDLHPTCAECSGKFCREGDLSKAPRNCPSVEQDVQTVLGRYTEPELVKSKIAAEIEGEGYCRWTRIEEIMEYARRCGYRRLGLAFCVGLSREAAVFSKILRANGFEVVSVCCKNGSVSKEELGITPDKMVHRGESFEGMCNPAGQAAILDEHGCQLNILLGLCVGHDTLFISHSRAPITVLAAKDRVTGHNPIAPLNMSDSYVKRFYSHFSETAAESEK